VRDGLRAAFADIAMTHPFRSRLARALALGALLAAPLAAQHTEHAKTPSTGEVKLLPGLGDHRWTITTREPRAQQFFNQGLALAYGFNHAEAERAFAEAARLDPSCAMCEWGVAYVLGPNINAPMDSASGVKAFAAMRRAQEKAAGASEKERALIEALATRYAAVPPADRAALEKAYADAMGRVAARYPDDHEAATLHAEALMMLSPWSYWTKDGQPLPQTSVLVSSLEKVMAANPRHPGACHFYIHAVESAYPEKAVACAERLAALMPGAGHIVHMPGHIYIRVGRWDDAIRANEHAVHADESYIADQRPSTFYTAAYYPHNYHFMAFAATMAGRSGKALEASRKLIAGVPMAFADIPDVQQFLPYVHLALAKFGRWNDVLREPMPEAKYRLATGLASYARGLAFSATGKAAEAKAALDTVRSTVGATTAEPWKTVLRVAEQALAGDIAAKAGDKAGAVRSLEQAVALEDALPYMEPPFWPFPMRHALGAALLEAGRAPEAEVEFRRDLARFPKNGWSLTGLARALEAQGKTAAAETAREEVRAAWKGADIRLATSRF
jgi:tetratricopeptide (TPR) repeat protein